MFDYQVDSSNMWREIHDQPHIMKNVIMRNKDIIQKICEEVKERNIKHIVLVGRGSSEHALIVGKYVFEIFTEMLVTFCAPSVITQYDGKMILKDTLTIGISQCGEAKDVYTVLKKCQESGGIAVSITNEPECLMRTVGNYYINCECGKETSFTAAKSYMSQMIITMMFAGYLAQDEKLMYQIEQAPKMIQNTIESSIHEQIKKVMPLFRNTQDILIIARGLSYAVAQETELKIMEASYTNTKVYSSCDYPHGPIATTNRFIPVIFYLTDENTDESTVKLIHRMKEDFHISCLIVTNKEKYRNLGNATIMLDSLAEGVNSVFALTIFSQMFACLLSFSRGYHPDEPIGLSKTTITY